MLTQHKRLIDRIFEEIVSQEIEVYADDMVVKSTTDDGYLKNLAKVFYLLKNHDLKFNANKCFFDVQVGEFLGFVSTFRGIVANPTKCRAIIEMKSPVDAKEIQILTGRVEVLSRFMARSFDKVKPIF